MRERSKDLCRSSIATPSVRCNGFRVVWEGSRSFMNCYAQFSGDRLSHHEIINISTNIWKYFFSRTRSIRLITPPQSFKLITLRYKWRRFSSIHRLASSSPLYHEVPLEIVPSFLPPYQNIFIENAKIEFQNRRTKTFPQAIFDRTILKRELQNSHSHRRT